MLARRTVLAGLFTPPGRQAPMLRDLVRHPLLRRAYGGAPMAPDTGYNAGLNRGGFKILEEQRQGTEWIVRGVASKRDDWIETGWKVLDRGLEFQQPDGGFGKWSYFHSTSLFVEALARALLLDPTGANDQRIGGLRAAVQWLGRPNPVGAAQNAPYTHRRYILTAAFGESAAVLFAPDGLARTWARRGLALQRPDGLNPEAGGFDVSYQIVGPLHALRYLPVCQDPALASSLRGMIRKAVGWELARMRPDGSMDAAGSSRITHEHYGAAPKAMNYFELFEVLAYGAQLIEPSWSEPARRVGRLNGWA